MSFDHWLVREFPSEAQGIPAGLTALGRAATQQVEAHFSMLGNGISFVSYDVDADRQPVRAFRPRKARHAGDQLDDPRPAGGRAQTFAHADQMTFEGFDPDRGLRELKACTTRREPR